METYNSIEVTKQLVKDGKISQEIAETIFPELKESEDERIRKTLINIVKGACDKYGIKYQGKEITEEKLLAWLEKQGSQNLANSEKTCKDEQNPAWSEEDEKMVGRIRGIIERYAFSQSAVDVNGDLCELEFIEPDEWLKSLKERVKPQQKPAWSEKNEAVLDALIQWLEGEDIYIYPHLAAECLKSLKERYTWKPSDKQMDALETYIYNPQYFNSPDPRFKLVESVYNDLKKLKG